MKVISKNIGDAVTYTDVTIRTVQFQSPVLLQLDVGVKLLRLYTEIDYEYYLHVFRQNVKTYVLHRQTEHDYGMQLFNRRTSTWR